MTAVAPRRRRKPIDRPELARKAILIGFAFIAVGIPLWLVLVNSVKPLGEANQLGLGLPRGVVRRSRTTPRCSRTARCRTGLRNTVLIAIPTVTIVLLLGGHGGLGVRPLATPVRVAVLLPVHHGRAHPARHRGVRAGAAHASASRARIRGSMLFYCGAWMAFCIFLTTGFVKTIPVELEEAARLDGAGSLTIFRKIIFPLMLPVNIAAGFILLLFVWNDLLYAFFMLNGNDNRTLILGLFNVVSGYQYQIRWNLVFADVVIVEHPPGRRVPASPSERIVGGLLGAGTDK